MKKTYKLVLETVNGQTREVVVVSQEKPDKEMPEEILRWVCNT